MSSLLALLGGAVAAHPWRTITAWLVILGAAISLSVLAGGEPRDDYRVPDSAAQEGTDFIAATFPVSGTDARVVVQSPGVPLSPGSLQELSDRLRALPHVVAVDPPRLSADGDTAIVQARYDVPVTDFKGSEGIDALTDAVQPLRDSGVQAELGGQVPENFAPPSGMAEAIGMLAALIILVIAFGSVVAAGLPLAVALVGLGVGASLVTVLAAITEVSAIAPTVASMVGIGVGIDYALLLVTRHVEGLRAGLTVREAAARANATAGVSVVFAGTTVLVSLLGLRLAGLPVYDSFGYATLIVVLAVMLTSISLVPALCGLAGTRVLSRRQRAAMAAGGGEGPSLVGTHRSDRSASTATARWAQRIGRRPWPWALGALVLLLALAAPVLGMRTWPQDASSQPDTNTTRKAYDLVDSAFGPGANGPLVIAVDLGRMPAANLPEFTADLGATPGVAAVTPPVVSSGGDAAIISVQPTTSPGDPATTELIDQLRATAPDGVMITGLTATLADISHRLAERLWLVIAFVVLVSVLLLTMVFRSIVVALTAAAMNMLSVGAAYGVVVAVFQWGWGAELLGLPHAVPVSSWVPILMFTILFGLSMDYQVFLLSRIRENYLISGDPRGSVVRGLASTGRVITSAAAIMVAVFLGFALDADPTVKMMGLGMAVAVFIDATVVRMALAPAVMAILGRANWWLPRWMDRVLPRLDPDGAHLEQKPDTDPAGGEQDSADHTLASTRT